MTFLGNIFKNSRKKLQILDPNFTCHAEQHQVGQLEQIRGGGVRDPATVVNIQLGERLSRHHYYYEY